MRLKTDLQKLNISFSSFTTTIMKQIKTKPRAPCSSACSTDRINLLNLDFHSCICRQTPEPSSEDSLNPFCTSESVTRCNTTPSHAPPYRLSGGISSGEGKSVQTSGNPVILYGTSQSLLDRESIFPLLLVVV